MEVIVLTFVVCVVCTAFVVVSSDEELTTEADVTEVVVPVAVAVAVCATAAVPRRKKKLIKLWRVW